MLRPAGLALAPEYVTANVASTYPLMGGKKTCAARLACTSVRLSGSLGLSAALPIEFDVNVPCSSSMSSELLMLFPEAGRSGDL
jgi:hypothetical protein